MARPRKFTATPPTPGTRYPGHDPRAVEERRDKPPESCGYGGILVLPEQVRVTEPPDAKGPRLFCLRCLKLCPAEPEQVEQAQAAARAEGFTPHVRVAPIVCGDLLVETRYHLSGLLRLERLPPAPPYGDRRYPSVPHVLWNMRKKSAEEERDVKGHDAKALALIGDSGELTDKGRALAALVVTPEVPDHVLLAAHDGGKRYARAERKRQGKTPRRKAETPPVLMVCTCGHGVALHTGTRTGKRGLEPCDVPCRQGCGCLKYRQAKPAKSSTNDHQGETHAHAVR